MKKILIAGESQGMHQFKADLHRHTTLSDGQQTPEEVKTYYRENGYDIVAFTDHTNYYVHNDLTDDTFLALNGVETDTVWVARDAHEGESATNHVCWVALTPDISEETVWKCFPNVDPDQENDGFCKTNREFTPENVSRLMKLGHDTGFFVTYNHPLWSHEMEDEYLNYTGMDAMEIVNNSGDGWDEACPDVYDKMLRAGKKIYCVSTDDSHSHDLGGFVMICAPKLEYLAVTDALVKGNFYAMHDTKAPRIKSLVWEDGELTLDATNLRNVRWYTDKDSGIVYGRPAGWKFRIPADAKYFRLELQSSNGSTAYTNAYFPADF